MLETVDLPGPGHRTTRLGFGGSGLMGGLSERESLRLLETAFDAGIRHFDVAPSYGHGEAERCLGKFLRGKSDRLTVTTKYGILPPRQASVLDVARSAVRPIVRALPAARNRLARAANRLNRQAEFSAEEARLSLERSLRELALERIDIFLLHEATAESLDSSDLLPFLQQMRASGKIGAFGIGSERVRIDAISRYHRAYCDILQFEYTLDPLDIARAFVVLHRAISGGPAILRDLLAGNPSLSRKWSDMLDADLANFSALGSLFLQAALQSNPGGLVLFSSRVPEHIVRNIRIAEDPAWAARGKRFLELIAQQRANLPRTAN